MHDLEKRSKIIKGLRKSKVFAELAEEELDHLLQLGKLMEYTDGAVIIREGDTSNQDFYIMLDGTVAITLDKEGSSIEVTTLTGLNTFGELAFVTNQPRTASVVTRGKAVVMVFSATAVNELLASHPALGSTIYRNIINLLSEKLTKANDLIKNNAVTYLDSILSELDL
ncbi:MAG: hypothetical protein A2284_08875 [Deltaproteobacteria bacterium RIFOXYA12_FULL_61_11]|nr:MAG: hypothetical protein A2284_08875 [Deltaproteobacteria bacterium RIFOXYA12_FULL_61_11]